MNERPSSVSTRVPSSARSMRSCHSALPKRRSCAARWYERMREEANRSELAVVRGRELVRARADGGDEVRIAVVVFRGEERRAHEECGQDAKEQAHEKPSRKSWMEMTTGKESAESVADVTAERDGDPAMRA